MNNRLKIFCVTNKPIKLLENSDLILGSLEDINKVKKLKISNHKELFKINNFETEEKLIFRNL